MTRKAIEKPHARGRVLGKGLSALIEAADLPLVRTEGREVRDIPISDLVQDPRQPRKIFDQDKLEELAASIREVGLLQPVLVRVLRREEGIQEDGRGIESTADGASWGRAASGRPRAELAAVRPPEESEQKIVNNVVNNKITHYLVVAGERRVRAARLAGLATVPALVCSFEETETLRVALMENIQRENLGPIEEAEAYRRLLEAYGATQEELANLLGKNRSTVANILRLLTLEEDLQALVEDGTLTRGHAKALLTLPPGQDRLRLARLCRSRGLSVREVERRAQGMIAARQRARGKRNSGVRTSSPGETPEVRALRTRAEEFFGSPVVIDRSKSGPGRIIISFYGDADLERLLAMMGLQTDLG